MSAVVHPEWCDPSADLRLATTDNVTFMVPSYLMKSASSVLRDTLSIPFSPSPTSDHSIPFDGTSTDLALFLELIQKRNAGSGASWHDLKRVYDLAEKYECEVIVERILYRLRDRVTEAPWETFLLAAEMEDLLLAKKALGLMGQDRKHSGLTVQNMKVQVAKQVPLAYLLGMMRAMIGGNSMVRDPNSGKMVLDWVSVGNNFNPST